MLLSGRRGSTARPLDKVKNRGCDFDSVGVVVQLGLRYAAWARVIPGSNPGDPTNTANRETIF